MMVKELGKKLIAQNKKARHDYSIEDVFECGIVSRLRSQVFPRNFGYPVFIFRSTPKGLGIITHHVASESFLWPAKI